MIYCFSLYWGHIRSFFWSRWQVKWREKRRAVTSWEMKKCAYLTTPKQIPNLLFTCLFYFVLRNVYCHARMGLNCPVEMIKALPWLGLLCPSQSSFITGHRLGLSTGNRTHGSPHGTIKIFLFFLSLNKKKKQVFIGYLFKAGSRILTGTKNNIAKCKQITPLPHAHKRSPSCHSWLCNHDGQHPGAAHLGKFVSSWANTVKYVTYIPCVSKNQSC